MKDLFIGQIKPKWIYLIRHRERERLQIKKSTHIKWCKPHYSFLHLAPRMPETSFFLLEDGVSVSGKLEDPRIKNYGFDI